ncbi:LruC domain-containing protein [Leptospira interrogans]|uniref:LruC domain-containing protein n=1 Tax=Leptospira interrogans TaxID=173 RepID=UPI001E3DEA5B|nr:LruC domain-containing protein [Leptospira interrogans]MCD1167007.1 LruC domain-containing protein [Leptospira interrogans]MCH1894568.1 LruC domain-containing protein [Leptospira interrogans]MCH1897562.1 LruC domain-containing protein [Leptospira interrogans]MCH1904742.1 LruC domain-containing protein [Leptospira interrogans]
MKKILILLIALSFVVFGCSHKKKGILLPFLTLLNQDAGASTAKSESSAGTATASNGGSVVIVDNTGRGNNSSGVLLPNNNSDSSSNATTNSQTSGNNSSSAGSSNNSSSSGSNSNSGSNNSNSNSGSTSVGSNSDSGSSSGSNTGSSSSSGGDTNTNSGSTNVGSNSDSGSSGSNAGSGSSSGSDTSTGTGSNNGSSNPSTPSQEITGVITVNDQIGSIPFTYNTVQTIPLNLVVTDKQSKPISGATVIVSDNEGHILFQGISNNIGKVSGTITVETALGQITLEITAAGESISNVINLINVVGINREIKYEVLLPVAAAPTDTDKDGVPDTLDTYPQDPTRSSLIRIPAEGVSTVAYEDLYPSAGDADLNDYVLHIHNEEDLNAAGDVIRLRGTYQHVARGAGYKHTFFLKLPVAVGATFSRKVVREDGKIVTDLTTKTVSSSDLNLGIQIHEESNKTTSNPNVNPGGVYKPGYIATIEIVFNSPVKKTALGSYPYDIFIKVINTGKEIHFPGLYKNANGTDKYLDSNNFPWAILVPGAWKYPYEGLDIRKDAQTGYKEFNLWVASNGTSYKDWYKHITNQAKVFPVPDEDSELMGFLLRSMKKNAILIAILLIGAGAAVAYILKRRTLSQA